MEEPYIPKYTEYEVENFRKGTTRISLRPIKISAFEPSPILRHSENARISKFSLLGFSGMKPLFPLASIAAVFQMYSETSLIQKRIPPIDSP